MNVTRRTRIGSILFVVLTCISFLQAQTSPLTNSTIEKRVNDLLRQMTLEEKIGQLNQYSAGTATGPGTGRTDEKEMVGKGLVGSLFNLTGPEKVNEMQRLAMEKSRLHIPLLFGLDVIHGYRTTFPVPLGMSASWNTSLIESAARIAAKESSADGIRWTFSPMVDIARDARWGRITEGAGEDPYLGAAIGKAYVRGYQGDLTSLDNIAACVKHYVGYGAAESGRDYNTTDIPERSLRQVYLPPFKAAIDAGALSLMSAFNAIDGVPSTANPFTLRQVLRREWGFKGLVVSDWTAVEELMNHGIANDGSTAAMKAFRAGVDMDMQSNLYYAHLPALVKSGAVPMSEIDESVRNVLRVKFALGLFEHPYADTNKHVFEGDIPAESREVARKIAEESFVLLKNGGAQGHVLPLQPKAGMKIALIGPLADSREDMQGSWQGAAKPQDAITLRQSLTAYAEQNNIKVQYVQGCTDSMGSSCDNASAVEAAGNADVVLLALGEKATEMTGEASSRTKLNLPGQQEALLDAVAAAGKPTVLLVFSGRPLVLTSVEPKVNAILEAWFPGVEAGPALVNTLFGKNNPSGRLTASFPRSVGQEPLYYNALSTGRPAKGVDLTHAPANGEDKYKSRYIDESNAPLYPFGYGLSYSDFAYSQPTLSTTSVSAKTLNAKLSAPVLHVKAEVKNNSTVPGQEVVQLYIRQTGTSIARPVRELKGFQKVSLAAGESKQLDFALTADDFAFWNIDVKHVAEPAKVQVWVSHDSTSGTPVELQITQ